MNCYFCLVLFSIHSVCATSDPFIFNQNRTADNSSEIHHELSLSDIVYGHLGDMGQLTDRDFQNGRRIPEERLAYRPDLKKNENPFMFQGDINPIGINDKRNAIIGQNFRWPNATIPYVISTSYTAEDRSIIARAILEFHDKTCIRFVPRTIQSDYIIFKTTGSGCNSNVGRTGGWQVVSLDAGCVHVSLVIHELMHATGFFHEQARADRDDYVIINWSNIQSGQARNFDKLNLNQIDYLGTQYDTGSVMHYDQFAFANDRNVPTIYSKTGTKLGNTIGFSPNDAVKINRMYNCNIGTTTSTTSTTSTQLPRTAATTTATTKPQPITQNPSTTAPSTTVPQGDCVDTISDCVMWSSGGYCVSNADLMSAFCKKTCNLCISECNDSGANCWQWVGQCGKPSDSNYMATFCRKTCGFC